MTRAIEPTEPQLEAFMKADQTAPIGMLNLLKFRDKAEYKDGRDAGGLSGQDAYGLYGLVAMEKIKAVGGRFFWGSPSSAPLIGSETDEWDMVAIIRYPSRKAFLEMIAMPDYQAALAHREAGLAWQALIPCRGDAIPE
ncbi:DUF1330 domain-containing protein [Parvibaculum sedimenti]|uniref:DUF1330 domain-containing protein n=1 Tax=Parvibaculum sedimenti TaxID=2608632 RepID=A0A6N6VQE6_9HYPH|nr:DUF1330 domain-containing protein [Parvibaculum sedimenti]KAB7741304.1 DUF1330 domain-containing protein [Parvibaculum sedimenti]